MADAPEEARSPVADPRIAGGAFSLCLAAAVTGALATDDHRFGGPHEITLNGAEELAVTGNARMAQHVPALPLGLALRCHALSALHSYR